VQARLRPRPVARRARHDADLARGIVAPGRGYALDMTLRRYRERSPAGRSPEPPGRQRTDQPRGASAEALRSAVQHHEASSDHHDFRLDFDDVLAPRAAPNGPSINPKNK